MKLTQEQVNRLEIALTNLEEVLYDNGYKHYTSEQVVNFAIDTIDDKIDDVIYYGRKNDGNQSYI